MGIGARLDTLDARRGDARATVDECRVDDAAQLTRTGK